MAPTPTEDWLRAAAPEVERHPEFSAVADGFDGATVEIMDDLGHFPMVERPARFRTYLLPAPEDARAG